MQRNATATTALRTLAAWSSRYNWQARAEAYDAELERRKNEEAERIMAEGLALAHNRVKELDELYDTLRVEFYERGEDGVLHNLWVPDVKQIGSGQNAERVDLERYNSAIVSDLRGVLDDIAKETGGRKGLLDVTSGGEKVGSSTAEDIAEALAIVQRSTEANQGSGAT